MHTYQYSRESCLCHSEYCLQCKWVARPVCCSDLSSYPEPQSDVSLPDLCSAVSDSPIHFGNQSVAVLHLPVAAFAAENQLREDMSVSMLEATLYCYRNVTFLSNIIRYDIPYFIYKKNTCIHT